MIVNYHLNKNQDTLTASTSWDIPLNKNGILTEAQCSALQSYCNKFVTSYIDESALSSPMVITPGTIYRLNPSEDGSLKDRSYYDAETGKLYTTKEILRAINLGKHEIRLKEST